MNPLWIAVPLHRLDRGPATVLGSDRDQTRAVTPGSPVLLRLVNASDNAAHTALRGVDAALVAIDGTPLNGRA
jgi:hypothetical protein